MQLNATRWSLGKRRGWFEDCTDDLADEHPAFAALLGASLQRGVAFGERAGQPIAEVICKGAATRYDTIVGIGPPGRSQWGLHIPPAPTHTLDAARYDYGLSGSVFARTLGSYGGAWS